MTIFSGVRRGDVALAVVLTALGLVLMASNARGAESGVRVDSDSWFSLPVFALATLAVLWRRRSMPAVLAVTVAALAVHVLAFGWLVRCGAGLPLSFALAYGVGRLSSGRQTWAGLAAVVGVQVLVLVRDSAAGLEILPVTALLALAAWGIGLWLRRRSERSTPAEQLVPAAARA